MEITNPLYMQDLDAWRSWLVAHHQSESRLWLIFYKAHTGRPCITYNEALDEALCYGWIDSLLQRIDDDTYARLFTRRTNANKWSAVNRVKVKKLLAEGRMQPAGLALLPPDLDAEIVERAHPEREELPEFIRAGLEVNPKAKAYFEKLPPSHQRQYLGWILDAKREETQQKRLAEAIERLENEQRLEGK
jgi:uncharacterized protein YdeI (YjbR/CyaY-like superfamily)